MLINKANRKKPQIKSLEKYKKRSKKKKIKMMRHITK